MHHQGMEAPTHSTSLDASRVASMLQHTIFLVRRDMVNTVVPTRQNHVPAHQQLHKCWGARILMAPRMKLVGAVGKKGRGGHDERQGWVGVGYCGRHIFGNSCRTRERINDRRRNSEQQGKVGRAPRSHHKRPPSQRVRMCARLRACEYVWAFTHVWAQTDTPCKPREQHQPPRTDSQAAEEEQ